MILDLALHWIRLPGLPWPLVISYSTIAFAKSCKIVECGAVLLRALALDVAAKLNRTNYSRFAALSLQNTCVDYSRIVHCSIVVAKTVLRVSRVR